MMKYKNLLYVTLAIGVMNNSCVSKKKYVESLKRVSVLKADSISFVKTKDELVDLLASKDRRLKKLEQDSIESISYFDKNVNSIIDEANSSIEKSNEEYRREIQVEINSSNKLLLHSIQDMFLTFIDSGLLKISIENSNVQLKLATNKLYNKDSIEFNESGFALLKKINSVKFKKLIENYNISARNEISYKFAGGKTETANLPSLIFEDFLVNTNLIQYSLFDSDAHPNGDYEITDQQIIINLSKGIPYLVDYYITYRAFNGKIIMPSAHEANRVLYTMGLAIREISIFYGPRESIKYLLYPTDYIDFDFENKSDEEVLKKLDRIKKSPSVTVLKGIDRQIIACNCPKAIVVVHEGKVLKKFSRRTINCVNDINLEQ